MPGERLERGAGALQRPLLAGPPAQRAEEEEDVAAEPMAQQLPPPSAACRGATDESLPGSGMTVVYTSMLHGWGELVKALCCPLLCCGCGPSLVIEQGYVGVMTRFGVFERVLQPGMYVYNCMSQRVRLVCMKMQTVDIPRQAAMTRDNLKVQVDAVTFVTVVDPGRATFQVDNYLNAVKTLAASTLLRVIGEHTLQEIFRDRSKINRRLTQTMQGKTGGWGLQVAGVEMRDITIPDIMQRSMAQIAEANREAEAKVIVAEGQRKAAFIFADAAEAMERNPMSMQLQWFETLRQITAEKNSTVVVPDSMISTIAGLGLAQIPHKGGGGSCSGGTLSAYTQDGGTVPAYTQDAVAPPPPSTTAGLNVEGSHAKSDEVWLQVGPQASA